MKMPNKNDEIYFKVYDKVLNFLSFKIRTEREIENRLDRYLLKVKDPIIHEDVKERVLDSCKRAGFIDDKLYTKSFIEGKTRIKFPPGSQKIRQFLMKKGIDTSLIGEGLEKYYSYDDEFSGALGVGSRKYTILLQKNIPDFERIQKVKRFLFGKGYSIDAINAVIDTFPKVE